VGGKRQVRQDLRTAYHKAKQDLSDLGFEDCQSQLLSSINLYARTTLVLDALDECNPESRYRLIDIIEDLLRNAARPLQIFVSSRADGDIYQRFNSRPFITVQALHNQEDVSRYVKENIARHRYWKDMNATLKQDIVDVLIEGSDGM
jgi:ankyrin repeat domain-containing protein 50